MAMPDTDELERRLVRVANIVVGSVEYAQTFDPPNMDATGRATTAVAIWELLCGLDSASEAIAYAQHVTRHAISQP